MYQVVSLFYCVLWAHTHIFFSERIPSLAHNFKESLSSEEYLKGKSLRFIADFFSRQENLSSIPLRFLENILSS